MGKIQEQFNSNSSADFILTPGEYEGPLVVDRACTIDGCRSTLWANNGPVLTVAAPNVTVKNLRIEVTGSPTDENARIAMKTNDPYTKLENIEVHGNVIGFSQEAENWDLPGIISLGEFAANKENTFAVSLQAPSEATLDSKVKDLRISPTHLSIGQNSLTLTTDELRNNTILYGEIMVRSAVSRRIYVTGKALKDAPVHDEALPVANGPTVSLPVQIDPPAEVIAPQVSDTNVQAIKRGQRIRKADNISNQANSLRTQANNVNSLRGIVGNKYAGKDAQAYGDAVTKAKDELTAIASELDDLARRIRSAAKEIKDEEETELALQAERSNSAK